MIGEFLHSPPADAPCWNMDTHGDSKGKQMKTFLRIQMGFQYRIIYIPIILEYTVLLIYRNFMGYFRIIDDYRIFFGSWPAILLGIHRIHHHRKRIQTCLFWSFLDAQIDAVSCVFISPYITIHMGWVWIFLKKSDRFTKQWEGFGSLLPLVGSGSPQLTGSRRSRHQTPKGQISAGRGFVVGVAHDFIYFHVKSIHETRDPRNLGTPLQCPPTKPLEMYHGM